VNRVGWKRNPRPILELVPVIFARLRQDSFALSAYLYLGYLGSRFVDLLEFKMQDGNICELGPLHLDIPCRFQRKW
jgi:hypothetical protein